MSKIITIIMVLVFAVAIAPAYADCTGDLAACEELLDECTGCEEIECEENTWIAIAKDKKLTALITSAVLLVGGIAGVFIAPP